MNPRDRVLAHVTELLTGVDSAAVSARGVALACDLTASEAAGVLTALVREGRLVELRSHRSGGGGRRKRSRVLALP